MALDALHITGGIPLHGSITVSGAKNAALPLMAASLLTEEPLTLTNVPHLADISTMVNLLAQHGVTFRMEGDELHDGHAGRVVTLHAHTISSLEAPYDIVRKMRASVLVLGPLLARFGEAKVSLPGGCAIGTRPIDMHLKALQHMGASISLEGGYVHATCKGKLHGAEIIFDKVSVGATENILMAASLAEGTTIIRNAAREPEVSDLAKCLVAMGADIEGIGSDTLTIEGIDKLHAASHTVVADRIECGTYMVAAAITGGELNILGVSADIVGATIEKLLEAGTQVEKISGGLYVKALQKRPKAINITTQPFPGFATDMQAQFMALATIADGTSIIHETIFENRFMHAPELVRMGADITVEGDTAIIRGVETLQPAEVMATDLRASVSLVLAALVADGTSQVNRIYHLDRGYERLEEKLAACGAKIQRIGV